MLQNVRREQGVGSAQKSGGASDKKKEEELIAKEEKKEQPKASKSPFRSSADQ